MNSKLVLSVVIVGIVLTVAVVAGLTGIIGPNPFRTGEVSTSSSSALTSQVTSSTTQTVGCSSSAISTAATAATTTNTANSVTYRLQVVAELQNGTQLNGVSAGIISKGLLIANSPLPTSFVLTGGNTYNVTICDNGNHALFTQWSSGAKTRSINVVLDRDTKLIASYRPFGLQTISVLAKTLIGKTIAGVGVNIISYHEGAGGAAGIVKSGNTIPTNVTAKYGQTYTIVTNSTGSLAFKYWNNNVALTNNSYTLKVQGNLSITAYYQQLPLPQVRSGTGNHTITVVANTMDGGELVGAYFQVRINGVWNHYADGFTPASVTVPAGIEELVMYHCAQVTGFCSDKFFVYRYYNNTAPNTLTRWQYINLTSDIRVNSFYEIIPASDAVHVTIEAMNSSGPIYVNCTCGANITIYGDNGTPVAQSLEPYSFWLWKGRSYTVTVGDIPGYSFVRWTTE